MPNLAIRPVQSADIPQARQLILDGLKEHWGWLDETQNPDLNDIPGHYACGVFLVATVGGQIVGTGALLPAGKATGRIVRMSVAKTYRRKGIGRAILQALITAAGRAGYQRLVLETTATWEDAIAFYQRNGFRPVAEEDGNIHFVRVLNGHGQQRNESRNRRD